MLLTKKSLKKVDLIKELLKIGEDEPEEDTDSEPIN